MITMPDIAVLVKRIAEIDYQHPSSPNLRDIEPFSNFYFGENMDREKLD